MRLRRVVQAILRLRRIDEREMSYRDIVWENARESYEDSPDSVVDITPYIQARLDAAKQELLLKAHRDKRERDRRRRERRRRAATVATACLALLATVAGASAVTGVTTGVADLDRLLGTLGGPSGDIQDDMDSPRAAHMPTIRDRTLAASSTISLQAPTGISHPPRAAASFYLSASGYLCYVKGVFVGDGVKEPTGGGGCANPDSVLDRLEHEKAYVVGASFDPSGVVLVTGYADIDVRDIRVAGPATSLTVQLSGPWTPDSGRIEKMRTFMAVGSFPKRADGVDADLLDRTIDLRAYEIDVFVDGRWSRLTKS